MEFYSRMKIYAVLPVMIFACSGCVAMSRTPPADGQVEQIIPEKKDAGAVSEVTLPQLQNIKGEELEEYIQKKGVIFAKTEFSGLLSTRYVKFLFTDKEDPEHKFQLHIGEITGQQTVPWEVKAVRPGYFFVELPAGRYTITSVTIPVGSTTATEDMNVDLEVLADMICYVGTLKMVGTKERIKLGGVPVIKPGFEYTLDVIDEREEGAAAFKQNYPTYPHGVSIKLMKVNALSDKSGEDTLGG